MKNKTLREEIGEICDRLGRVCMKYGRGDLSEEYPPTLAAYELEKLFESKLNQREAKVREEIISRLRGLLMVDDWQPLYSEALSEIDKNNLLDELLHSLTQNTK